jgi:putative cell wall-binding protein
VAANACSSYGNRNFYNYFTDWFGSTQIGVDVCSPPPADAITPATGEYRVTPASLNARIAPTTECATNVRSLAQGTILTRTGVYGEWWRVRKDGASFWVHSAYLTPTPAPAYTSDRVFGADRFATSAAVSQKGFPATASTVYIASGLDFPDALSAAAAAGAVNASLLLAGGDALTPAVRAELVRLRPAAVVLVGGESVVSAGVEAAVREAVPTAVLRRLAGADRYATSQLVARDAFPSSTIAYIATGRGYADALAASAIAGAKTAPVLLVDGDASAADAATVSTLRDLGISSIVVAGGPGAVSAGTEASLRAGGFTVQRFGGSTRYETSLMMNAAAYPGATRSAYLATGVDFPDALSGAVMAGTAGFPLFIQPPSCMTGSVKDYLIGHGTTATTLIGGPGALTDGVARSERC